MTPQQHPAPAARIRDWLAARTLRGRLVAGLLALLALACATVGVVTYTHLHSVLISQLDSELSSANVRYQECVSPSPPPGQPPGSPPDDRHQPPYCAQREVTAAFTALVTGNGQVSDPYLAGSTSACHLSAADQALIASIPIGKPTTVDLTSHGQYRMIASKAPGGTVLVSGLPLSSVTDTLHQVAAAELAVFLAALLITGVIGTAWVR